MKAGFTRARIGLTTMSGWLATGAFQAAHAADVVASGTDSTTVAPVSAAASSVITAPVQALNLQSSTAETHGFYDLHTLMMIGCLAVFIVVFGAMLYSIMMHRKVRSEKGENFHGSTTIEILWTVVPFVIVIGMAIPATRTVMAMRDTVNADLTIKATGYQHKWGYDYLKGPGAGLTLMSALALPATTPTGDAAVDKPLVVPVGKKVRLIVTSADATHSWDVPAFGVKQAAYPGLIRDTWFRADKVGVYRSACAARCEGDGSTVSAASHSGDSSSAGAAMPVVVDVLSVPDFDRWVAAQRAQLGALRAPTDD